jgi:hypothetical protein
MSKSSVFAALSWCFATLAAATAPAMAQTPPDTSWAVQAVVLDAVGISAYPNPEQGEQSYQADRYEN